MCVSAQIDSELFMEIAGICAAHPKTTIPRSIERWFSDPSTMGAKRKSPVRWQGFTNRRRTASGAIRFEGSLSSPKKDVGELNAVFLAREIAAKPQSHGIRNLKQRSIPFSLRQVTAIRRSRNGSMPGSFRETNPDAGRRAIAAVEAALKAR